MPGPQPRLRSYLSEWLVLLAFMLTFVAVFGYSHFMEYHQVEVREYERLSSQAALIDKNLVSQIHVTRHALGSVAQHWASWRSADGNTSPVNHRLAQISDTLPGVLSIVVLDASGRVVASNNDRLLGVDLSGRDYFQNARQHPDPQTLFVTPPFRSTSKHWVIGMYRVMQGADKKFAGVVLAGIDSRYFQTLLESVRYTPDVWSYLAHGDGRLFMVQPERPGTDGMILTDADSFFVKHMRRGQVASVFTGTVLVTGEDRMIAFRTIHPPELLMDKPLVIAISRDHKVVFANWLDSAMIETVMFALLLVVCFLSLYFYQRRQRASDRLSLQQQETMQASEALLYAIFDASPDAMLVSDERDMVTMTNRQVEHILGFTEADLIGHSLSMLVPERFRAKHAERLDALSQTPVTRRTGPGLNVKSLRKDGSECDVEVSVSRVSTAEGDLFVSAMRDVTERKQAQEQLRIAAAAFESQEAMVVTDLNSTILQVNRAFTSITGFSAEDVVGQNPRLLKSGHHDAHFYRAMWQTIQATGSWQGEVFGRRKNGEIYPKWLTVSAVRGDDGGVTHYVGAHHDMTEQKKAQEKINELAFFDQLTGLPNRILLMDRVRQAMTACIRTGTCGALILIDLDNFKTLNDTLGHDCGDKLLEQVAQRLSVCVRAGDTVARLGGDEFVVVLVGLSLSTVDAASAAETFAQKILAALNAPYLLETATHHSTASLGATVFNGQQLTADELMKQADLAMYRSKDAGRNALSFFDSTMEVAVRERAALEGDLRRALGTQQFRLYYQAQVDDTGCVTGAEVLLRWLHPRRGLVSPADFIPLAEETGLIVPMGQWVLDTACHQLARWADQPQMSLLTIAVNVSVVQFTQLDFVDQVLEMLKLSGAEPSRLKLELTESLLVDKVEEIVSKMTTLKSHGVGFALDDFGTGYSSLAYLKRLPLDQLKIDQSFVRDVLIDPNDASIAKTIVSLAQSLGLGVIAEGVETQAQMDFLAAAGCRAYQGYLFSRPIPLAEFEEWVKNSLKRAA